MFPTIRWVFPQSRMRATSRFEHKEMSQWFDIWSVEDPDEGRQIQAAGLSESIAKILEIVRVEATTVPLEPIILGGISQGCATAILALLFGGFRLGGFMGLCSWLPFHNGINEAARIAPKQSIVTIRNLFTDSSIDYTGLITPIDSLQGRTGTEVFRTPAFLSHPKDDPVVPFENGKLLCWGLSDLGFATEFQTYEDGGHWIKGMRDMVSFIEDSFKISAESSS